MKTFSTVVVLSIVMLALASCGAPTATAPTPQDTAQQEEAPNAKVTPRTTPGISYLINGKSKSYDVAPLSPNAPAPGFITITTPDILEMQLRRLPNAVGTYQTGEGESDWQFVDALIRGEMGNWYYANNAMGDVQITLTSVGTLEDGRYTGAVQGTFAGTFADGNGQEVIVTDGTFYSEQQ